MNIQIFGTSKCFDTKKAQRYFKERGIKFQMIDLKEKGMSRGEFDNVARALGGWEALVNPAAKDKQTLALLDALVDWQKGISCLKISSCSRPPSCATDVRPLWATSPRYGRTGNKKPAFTKKPPVQVLHSAAGCGILLGRLKTLGDSDQ